MDRLSPRYTHLLILTHSCHRIAGAIVRTLDGILVNCLLNTLYWSERTVWYDAIMSSVWSHSTTEAWWINVLFAGVHLYQAHRIGFWTDSVMPSAYFETNWQISFAGYSPSTSLPLSPAAHLWVQPVWAQTWATRSLKRDLGQLRRYMNINIMLFHSIMKPAEMNKRQWLKRSSAERFSIFQCF